MFFAVVCFSWIHFFPSELSHSILFFYAWSKNKQTKKTTFLLDLFQCFLKAWRCHFKLLYFCGIAVACFLSTQLNKSSKIADSIVFARGRACDKAAPCQYCRNYREVKLNERLSWRHAWGVADLSKLGPGLLLLHSAMSHEVVKHFTWKQKGEKRERKRESTVTCCCTASVLWRCLAPVPTCFHTSTMFPTHFACVVSPTLISHHDPECFLVLYFLFFFGKSPDTLLILEAALWDEKPLNSIAGLVGQSGMAATELLPPYKVLKPWDHTYGERERTRERLNERKNKKLSKVGRDDGKHTMAWCGEEQASDGSIEIFLLFFFAKAQTP